MVEWLRLLQRHHTKRLNGFISGSLNVLSCKEAIANDKYAAELDRSDQLVGHIPIEISSLMYHFLNESNENRIEGMVIQKVMREFDLAVPVEYTAVTTCKMTTIIFLSELKKEKQKYKHFNM